MVKLKFRVVVEGEYEVNPEQYPEVVGYHPNMIATAEAMSIENAPIDFLDEHHLQVVKVEATVAPVDSQNGRG